MKKITFLLFLILSGNQLSAQNLEITRNNTQIREILTDWDAVRGDWLASGLTAMSNNQALPSRNFPERLTVSQLFGFVPQPKRDSVEVLLKENDSLRRRAGFDPVTIGLNLTRLMFSVNRRRNSLISYTYGEPHIVDFNGQYSMQNSVGEFVLAKSAGSLFEVQARFEKINENASFITALTMLVGGDTVSLYPNKKPDGKDYTALRVNGIPVTMVNSVHYLPMGGLITYENKQYSVQWPNGESAIIEIKPYQNNKFINIAIQVPTDNPRDYDGLTANAENEIEHRVKQDQTLFDYSPERGFEYFAELKTKATNKPSLSSVDREKALRTCADSGVGSAEMEGCIYDLGHFGIAPNPRPEFVHPADDLTLVKLDYPEIYSNETLANNLITDEISNPTIRKRKSLDPAKKQELYRAFFRIAMNAAENTNFGRVSLGR